MNRQLFSTLAGLALACTAWGECKVSEAPRKFEGAERNIVTMENERILVEIAPTLEGRLIRYQDKSKPGSPLEWLDDCAYHYNGRWEGKPFTHRVEARGPEKASVTVKGGGKIAVEVLRNLGIRVSSPLDLEVERTMTIESGNTRLRVDVKITNTGTEIAPALRYMVHSVYGNLPLMEGQRAFWFLPTANGVEFFDPARGNREMSAANGDGPLSKAFSRFIPARKADKPRYEPGGWGAVLTSAGPAYIFYDRTQYDFMQYWFGGDSSWHFTFEPHTKPIDLKSGESMHASFTLAYDSKDVPFDTPTVSYEQPAVPEFATPGSPLAIEARATTVLQDRPERAALSVEIRDPKGTPILARQLEGELKPFVFNNFSAEVMLAADAPLGLYTWTAKLADGRTLGTGKTEVLPADQLEKRKMAKALAETKEKYETQIKTLQAELADARKVATRWNAGVNLALELQDRTVWPETSSGVSMRITHGTVPVDGLWQAHEFMRIQKMTRWAPPALSGDMEKLLAPLGADSAFVRDMAAMKEGVAVLIVNAAKKRAEVVLLKANGLKRFGKFSETPGENDETLGAGARALAVDQDGNLWVATNAHGLTSAYKVNQDGAPFEESVIGEKGAVKKFAPEGRLLGAASLLDAPMDLVPASADGVPVMLVSYRQVSHYHTTQVREAVMVIRTADVQRISELKIPAGSVCVDREGRLWAADVAGHVTCHDVKGKKLFDAADGIKAAALEAKLGSGEAPPVLVRPGIQGALAIAPLQHTIKNISPLGAINDTSEVPGDVRAHAKLILDTGLAATLDVKARTEPKQ